MYKINKLLKTDLLKVIGHRPYVEIARLISMIENEQISSNDKKIVIDAIRMYPHCWVEDIIKNIDNYFTIIRGS